MFQNKYRFLVIPLLSTYSYINSVLSSVYKVYHIFAPWYYVLFTFFLITLGIWEANRVTGIALNKVMNPEKTTKLLAVFFGCGVLISILVSLFVFYIVGIVLLRFNTSETRIPVILTVTYATRVNLFLHILNAIFFYSSQLQRKKVEAEELKRMNTQAQLQAIKNQINPHFLFNNLNVLSTLVMKESPGANRFIEEFSKVYRHILSTGEKELISLKEELDVAEAYIYLLKQRFPESFIFISEIPPEFEDYLIVPVSIQMLIENAVKHNIVSRTKPLTICLKLTEKNQLMVENNLQLKAPGEPSTKTGLQNISQRYEIITKRKIEIVRLPSAFTVLIPLIQPFA